jgi:hypothetical protein
VDFERHQRKRIEIAARRVRQFVFSMAASQGGESMKVVSTMKFLQFDEPVSVSAPDASDTVPFSKDSTFFTDFGSSSASLAS